MRSEFRGLQALPLAVIQAVLSFEWLRAGIEKLDDPNFVNGMTGTVAAFAKSNPNGWYASFLTNTVQPNAQGFGYAVEYAELLTGIALGLGAIVSMARVTPHVIDQLGAACTGIGALVAAFMSLNFWQAAGWLDSATDGINVLMLAAECVLVVTSLGVIFGRPEEETLPTFAATGVPVQEPRTAVAR